MGRENIFSNLFRLLGGLEYKLQGQLIGCNKGCRAMMLGTLTQELKSISLWPYPFKPYTSLSIDSTLKNLRAIESLDYYCAEPDYSSQRKKISGLWILDTKPSTRRYPASLGQRKEEKAPSRLTRHECRLEDHLSGIIDTTASQVKGLELAKYLGV